MLIKIIKKNNKLKFLIFFLVGNNWNYYFSSNINNISKHKKTNKPFIEHIRAKFNLNNSLLLICHGIFLYNNRKFSNNVNKNADIFTMNKFLLGIIFFIYLKDLLKSMKNVSWLKIIINLIVLFILSILIYFISNVKNLKFSNEKTTLYLYLYFFSFLFKFHTLFTQNKFLIMCFFCFINTLNKFKFLNNIISIDVKQDRYDLLYRFCLFMFIVNTINEIIMFFYINYKNVNGLFYQIIYCIATLIIHNYTKKNEILNVNNTTPDSKLEKYLFLIFINIYFIEYLYQVQTESYVQLNTIFSKYFFQKLDYKSFLNLLYVVFMIDAIFNFISINIKMIDFNYNDDDQELKALLNACHLFIKDLILFVNLFLNILYTKLFPLISFNFYLIHNIKKNFLFFSEEIIKFNNIKNFKKDIKQIYKIDLLLYDCFTLMFQFVYIVMILLFNHFILNITNLSYLMYLYLVCMEKKYVMNNINNISNYSIISHAQYKNLPLEKTFNEQSLLLNTVINDLIDKTDNVFN